MAHLLEALAPGWEITLIAPAGPVPPSIADAIGVSLPQASTMPWRYDAAPLGEALDRVLAGRRFDRALMFAGAEALGFSHRALPPAVMDLIDCNALELWRAMRTTPSWRLRLYWLRELFTSVRYARRGFRAFAATICVGETDAAWLRRMGGKRIYVVPNGVALPDEAPPHAEHPVLSFTGTLDYHPNVDAALFAARAVFPHVRAALPEARLLIAGRRPAPEIRHLAALPGVEVIADVADMRAVLARTRVGLAPMRAGSGIKNKVLEAWACARPVVMTRVAANGLSVPEGHAGLIRDAAEAQAEAAVRLLREPGRAAVLGGLARAHVVTAFSWARQADCLDRILRAVGPSL
ncbi:MAG TPA: glycosyltransferase family 4 protein [Acetobacteraceae bacterium]|nr:glycosyltransferase family 4 protein [Acetobacteraceae bacterium]